MGKKTFPDKYLTTLNKSIISIEELKKSSSKLDMSEEILWYISSKVSFCVSIIPKLFNSDILGYFSKLSKINFLTACVSLRLCNTELKVICLLKYSG